MDKRIWIPRACKELIQRLCVIAHCEDQDHPGEQAMVNHVRRVFHISELRTVVHYFVASCLLGPHVKGGKMIRRPWSETIECNERNGTLHWDFLSLGEPFGENKYLLVLKDHATHFCEFVVCDMPLPQHPYWIDTVVWCPTRMGERQWQSFQERGRLRTFEKTQGSTTFHSSLQSMDQWVGGAGQPRHTSSPASNDS
ncbi:hypothetical protein PHMEG_00016398 [Phytophthora megakarya]|uniref:Uncharacterized protein n=1 Tax=Phytophthora megakarya TaxID=4795 RepID=A0A225W0L1_9STRA|nr:hypothetical protein PHMEG_00016398 [Phytophthora megakarya]